MSATKSCSCNGGGSSYNVSDHNGGGGRGYNVGGYTIIVRRALYKQLCWEFDVNHNCICIISEGISMYVVTCLETFYNFNGLL